MKTHPISVSTNFIFFFRLCQRWHQHEEKLLGGGGSFSGCCPTSHLVESKSKDWNWDMGRHPTCGRAKPLIATATISIQKTDSTELFSFPLTLTFIAYDCTTYHRHPWIRALSDCIRLGLCQLLTTVTDCSAILTSSERVKESSFASFATGLLLLPLLALAFAFAAARPGPGLGTSTFVFALANFTTIFLPSEFFAKGIGKVFRFRVFRGVGLGSSKLVLRRGGRHGVISTAPSISQRFESSLSLVRVCGLDPETPLVEHHESWLMKRLDSTKVYSLRLRVTGCDCKLFCVVHCAPRSCNHRSPCVCKHIALVGRPKPREKQQCFFCGERKWNETFIISTSVRNTCNL